MIKNEYMPFLTEEDKRLAELQTTLFGTVYLEIVRDKWDNILSVKVIERMKEAIG